MVTFDEGELIMRQSSGGHHKVIFCFFRFWAGGKTSLNRADKQKMARCGSGSVAWPPERVVA